MIDAGATDLDLGSEGSNSRLDKSLKQKNKHLFTERKLQSPMLALLEVHSYLPVLSDILVTSTGCTCSVSMLVPLDFGLARLVT